MEREEIIEKFSEFLNDSYKDVLLITASEGKQAIAIDFSILDKNYPDLANQLLDYPKETLDAMEEAITQFDLGTETKLKVRFFNLPECRNIRIRNIRSKHIGKMIVVDGIVKRASEIRPEVSEAIFQCPVCGNKISIIQTENFIRTPVRCECGNKRGFKLVGKKLYDARWIVVEEPFEITTGERPSELMIYLKEDLTSPKMQNKTDPGNRIKVTGILKELPKRIKGSKSRQMDIYLEANYVESVEIEWEEIEISEEDRKKIIELSKDPQVYEKLIASIAPSMYGMEEIKEAILLQLFGGEPHILPDGTRIRGDIHILIIGDPAAGKSQLMQQVTRFVPRARYVSGRGVTGAGLTATVSRDEEFLGGWVLDAGAVVMANKSVLAIDEFSKVSAQDQVALQEAMSLGSYHPNLEITLLNGTCLTIKELVENLLTKYKDRIKVGDECIWVELRNGPKILTTDFFKIYPSEIKRVSKHIAPKYFYKIRINNGKELIVTPDHPSFVLRNGEILTIRADKIKTGDYVPIPSIFPIKGTPQKFFIEESKIRGNANAKHISIPSHNSPQFCKFLGYMTSEGCCYTNRGREYGICFTNSEKEILKDFSSIVKTLFGLKPKIIKREGRTMLFYNSIELWNFLNQLVPTVMNKSYEKSLPVWVKKLPKKELVYLLRALFDGDGTVTEGKVKYTTTSEVLAKQIQDLLHIFGIISYFRLRKTIKERKCWDVIIGGKENLRRFLREIGFSNPEKNKYIQSYVKSKKPKPDLTNVVPGVQLKVKTVLKMLKMCQKEVSGYIMTDHFNQKHNFTKEVLKRIVKNFEKRVNTLKSIRKEIEKASSRKTLRKLRKKARVSTFELCKKLGVCHQMISYLELKAKKFPFERYKQALDEIIGEMLEAEKEVKKLKKLAFGSIKWAKVIDLEKIENEKIKWVYDVTTENEKFLSNGMILHNTISIAKASIVATLPAQTAILAGGNPKLGRFDPYIPIKEQVDISDVLLSRFDLKFALRDIPNPELDGKMADHILQMRHLQPELAKPLIDPDFLRKYIAYVRATVHPKLTKEAGDKLKEFYLEMREKSGEEAPVAITLRQYEALIRLAEASAKVRLSKTVEVEDALRAIKLMKVSLRQFGFEPETGKIDIDRAEGQRITSAQRSKIRIMLDIIDELSINFGKEIPMDEIIKKAKDQGVNNPEEILRKMQREGIIYSPSVGKVSKV